MNLIFRRVLLVLVFLIYIVFPIAAQSIEDSLELRINQASSDIEKANSLNDLAYHLRNSNISKAEGFYKAAWEISQKHSYKKGMADAYYGFGIAEGRRDNLDSALCNYDKAKEIYIQLGDYLGQARVYNSKGLIHYKKGETAEALGFFMESLNINERIDNSELRLMVNNNLGMVFKRIGETEKALTHYFTTLTLTTEIGHLYGKSIALNNIGLLYESLGKHKLAINYYSESLLIREQLGKRSALSTPLLNLGLSYEAIGDYDMALEYYKRSLEIKQDLNQERGIARLLNNIGVVYKAKKDYSNAAEYFQRSLDIKKRLNDNNGIAHTLYNYGNLSVLQGDLSLAMNYYKEAESIAIDVDNKNELKKIYFGMSECYKQLNSFKDALVCFEKFNDIQNQLVNEANNRSINNLEIKYFTEEKEKENLRLSEYNNVLESKFRLQYLLAVFLTISLVLMIMVALMLYRKKQQKVKVNNELERLNLKVNSKVEQLEVVNAQLKELTQFKQQITQMIIHDLKSPLSNIVNAQVIQDEELKNQMINQQAKQMLNLVQNILDVYRSKSSSLDLNKKSVNIYELIHLVKEEFKAAFSQKNIDFKICSRFKWTVLADEELLKRVVINLVSNAIKHSPVKGLINIKIEERKGAIKVSVFNQGPSIELKDQELIFKPYVKKGDKLDSTGLGLAFCKLAVEAHEGKIGVNSEDGEDVEFWFTLLYNDSGSEAVISDCYSDESFCLCDDDKMYLSKYIKALKTKEVFDITSINRVLNSIDKQSESIINWKTKVESTVYCGNKQGYIELLNIDD